MVYVRYRVRALVASRATLGIDQLRITWIEILDATAGSKPDAFEQALRFDIGHVGGREQTLRLAFRLRRAEEKPRNALAPDPRRDDDKRNESLPKEAVVQHGVSNQAIVHEGSETFAPLNCRCKEDAPLRVSDGIWITLHESGKISRRCGSDDGRLNGGHERQRVAGRREASVSSVMFGAISFWAQQTAAVE